MKYLNYKTLLILLTTLTLVGCQKNTEDYLNHLEGYWEIESVILADGKKKEYTFSNTIDYIFVNIDSLKGFRKKLKPSFNGTYETSKLAENFDIKIENDSLNMYYKTPYATWKETILNASEGQLRVINKDGIIYNYKSYEPINLD